jgi:hypothetical protein
MGLSSTSRSASQCPGGRSYGSLDNPSSSDCCLSCPGGGWIYSGTTSGGSLMADGLSLVLKTIATAAKTLFAVLPLC